MDLVDGAASSTHHVSVAVHELSSEITGDWTEVEGEDSLEIAMCSEATQRKRLQEKRGRRKIKFEDLASFWCFSFEIAYYILQFATYCAF